MSKKPVKKKTKKKTSKTKSTAASFLSTVRSDGKTVPAQTQTQKSTPPIITPMPTAGRNILEFEEQLDKQLAAGNDQEKRGRGRPRKEEVPPAPEIDVSVIGQVVMMPFDLWASSQKLPELKIEWNEAVMIAKPLKQLLDHYLPTIPTIAWAWISLAGVSYSIMKCRIDLIAEIRKQRLSAGSQAGKQAAVKSETPPSQGHGRQQPSAIFPSIKEVTEPTKE